MAETDYKMLDGSVVTIDGADVTSAWFGRVDWRPRNDGLTTIGSGARGGVENEPDSGWRVVQEATLKGGRVFAANSGPIYDYPQTILVYQIGGHELYARVGGYNVALDPWIRILNNLVTTYVASHVANGLSLAAFFKRYPTEAETQFETWRWPNGATCPHCTSPNIAPVAACRPMPRLPPPLLCQVPHRHARFETPLPHLAVRPMPPRGQPQRPQQCVTRRRPRHHLPQ